MEQEFSSPDVIGEGGVSLSPEAIKEASEKYQERAKKTQAQLQRIKKDERWAQGDNEILFQILSKFIQDPYYAPLIPSVTELLHITFPSRAIIGYIALLYPDAAYYLAHSLKKDAIMDALRGLHRYEDLTVFDEQILHPTIREWVTIWIGMMEKFLTQTGETSILMTKKTYDHMHTLYREKIEGVVADFFIFFFRTRNLDMSRSTGQAYASFIQKNLMHVLVKYIVAYQQGANIEENLLQETPLTADDLFGLQGS